GGIRTPLLVHGLIHSQPALSLQQLALYDVDRTRVELMALLSREVIRTYGGEMRITTPTPLEEAVEGASFVLSSLRVGGIRARARDERIAIEHGVVGQETTGPAGLAMALRTIPVSLDHARVIGRLAPSAWLINFTNPVGVITQALRAYMNLRVIGICDTPSELFHRIAQALGEPQEDVRCDYFGLNHLGWVQTVRVRGQDATARLLGDDEALRSLYVTDLFDPAMIRSLGLIPNEYVFFFYAHHRAYANQIAVGASRGEEIERLTADFLEQLSRQVAAGHMEDALESYRDYLRRRSGSYMRLEAGGESALSERALKANDPFEGATGYHRVAIEVMRALVNAPAARIVIDVVNQGAVSDLDPLDVVEVPCLVDHQGPKPLPVGKLPESVRGLVLAVKVYERLAIRAAVEKSLELARLALLVHPLVGQWELADRLVTALVQSDPEHLGYLWKGSKFAKR
ncbi:MAG: 6-phospho-beta-glucosidase, partial [candidate division WOR-3 bacterium]